jgi:hypothetical protein
MEKEIRDLKEHVLDQKNKAETFQQAMDLKHKEDYEQLQGKVAMLIQKKDAAIKQLTDELKKKELEGQKLREMMKQQRMEWAGM